jgi:hypothetical protein
MRRRGPQLTEGQALARSQEWISALNRSPEQCIPWLSVFRADQLGVVTQLVEAGVTPDLLHVVVRNGRSAGWLVRHGEPAHYVARLLRDQGQI